MEPIPVSGASEGPALGGPHPSVYIVPWPRRVSRSLVAQWVLGREMVGSYPQVLWSVSTAFPPIPLVRRLWTRRLMRWLRTDLMDRGYSVERIMLAPGAGMLTLLVRCAPSARPANGVDGGADSDE